MEAKNKCNKILHNKVMKVNRFRNDCILHPKLFLEKYSTEKRSFDIILHGQKQSSVLVQVDGKPVESGDLRFDPNAGTVSFRLEDDGKEHRVAWWREK